MIGKAFTDEQIEFIRENWQKMTDKEMGEALGRKPGGICNRRKNMGLVHFTRNEWSEEEEETLRELYPETEMEEILKKIPGRETTQIYAKAYKMGLKRTEEFRYELNKQLGLQQVNNPALVKNRFKKGHQPFNYGKSQEEYMSEEAIENTKKTRFKKGNEPHNTKFNGAISCRVDSKGTPYMHIRVAKGEWMLLHRHNWEKQHGPLPEGYILRCRDGNTTNCSPDNWEMITRAEHAGRNVNREKASAALRKYYQDHGHPAQELHDSYVAGLLAGGDKELREYLIQNRQDLIEVARKNYLLRRELIEIKNQ